LALACASLAAAPAAAQAPAKPAPPGQSMLHPVIYTMEQLRTGPLTPKIQQAIEPLNTMAEVEALLKANQVAFAWRVVDVGSDAMPPELAGQIAALKPSDVYVIPSPEGSVIGTIIRRH
jgi:hypothetical protein